MTKKFFITTFAAAACFMAASAHSVLLSENFNGDYSESFPVMIEGDHLPPISSINPLFMDKNGVSRPWNKGRDSSTSEEAFMMSHSCYQYPGASKDFLVSKPITVPTKGFTLSFGAQSVQVRGGEKMLSDLHLFIMEQAPTEDNLPTASQATRVFTQVPVGKDPDVVEGDFTPYELSLDEWEGKTVYIVFANLNEDKDILCIDDVLVQRLDPAEVSAQAPDYIIKGTFPLEVNLNSTSTEALGAWTMTVTAGSYTATETGSGLTAGQKVNKTFDVPVGGDELLDWKVRVQIAGTNDIEASGTTHGLLFTPDHVVLFEETTGTWCGNCPMGIYTMECMNEDPELKGKVAPVAVHIHDNARTEPMVCDEYANAFNLTIAPMFFVNRDSRLMGFTSTDCNYDSSIESSAAGTVLAEVRKLTLADIAITASKVEDGKVVFDTEVTPAITLDGTKHKLGFILTEDNVGISFDGLTNQEKTLLTPWMQHNYVSGLPYESGVNGWSSLPRIVSDVRFQHVARGFKGFWGLDGSLPDAPLKGGDAIKGTFTLDIPDTYKEHSSGLMTAPAVDPHHLNVIAYLINTETGHVLNCAQATADGTEHEHMDTRWLTNYLADVDSVVAGTPAEAEYFTIEGLRVATPEAGRIYIRRQGENVTKVIF